MSQENPKLTDAEIDYGLMPGAIAMAVNGCASNLENLASFLDGHFEGLEANELPEYNTAREAIESYKTALVEHYKVKFRESIESE